jgi:hypothetical protein
MLAIAPAATLIVAALLLEALAFALSDGLFANAVGTLYRELRTLMFKGLQSRASAGEGRPADSDLIGRTQGVDSRLSSS